MRLITIDPGADTMYIKTFSPYFRDDEDFEEICPAGTEDKSECVV